MVTIRILDLNGESSEKEGLELPEAFSRPLRPDIVSRAFWIVNSHGLQAYGRDPMAGQRTSAESGWPPTGRGISRVPRVKGERSRRSGQAAGVASVVGGRIAHPPKAEKSIYRKINKKEKVLALETAIAFTGDSHAVAWRGHKIGGDMQFPAVVTDDVEALTKTSQLHSFLTKIGLAEELERLYGGVKRRSGKPRMRGRAYKERIGPLLVVGSDRGVGRAAEAIPGVSVVSAESLSVIHLAPSGVAGRLTFWTESSLEVLRSRSKSSGGTGLRGETVGHDDDDDSSTSGEMKIEA